MQEYVTIYAPAEDEFVERKSRFIGAIAPVQTEEEAQAWIAQVRQQHRDATHNTYAYILRNGIKRYSDDGEPQGTAGVPMLDCIEKEGLVDVAVVVTRYFGGTLLGTGGLVRAYSGAVREALKAAVILERQKGIRLGIRTDYSDVGKIQYLIGQNRIPVLSSSYTDSVLLQTLVPEPLFDSFVAALTEATAGKAALTKGDSVWYALQDGQPLLFDREDGV